MKKLFLFSTLLSCSLSWSLTNEEAFVIVKNALRNLTYSSTKTYCVKGTQTCRQMVQLKDTRSSKPSEVFFDTFYSVERNVGSTCYFIPVSGSPGKYLVASEIYEKAIPNADGLKPSKITLVSPLNATIDYSYDRKDVIFYNLKMPKLGTNEYTLATMVQSEGLVYIEGTVFPQNQKIRIDYARVR